MARLNSIVLAYFLFTVFICRHPVMAAEDAYPLVAKAMQAKISQTYQARQDIVWALPVEQGGSMMEIITQTAHAGIRSRTTYLFPPEAAGRVMTDDGVQTSIYEPVKRTLLLQPSATREMASDLPSLLALLRRNYHCIKLHREQVNGRECAVVLLRSRRMDEPCKVLWIDEARPFVLRLEEHNAAGNCCYVSSYDSIVFAKKLAGDALSMPPSAKTATRRVVQATDLKTTGHAMQALAAAGIGGRIPAWVPGGYSLLSTSLLVQASTGQKMVQLRYSDGLRTLTVLQGKATDTLPTPASLRGLLARYGLQAWAQDAGAVRVMVRGDLSLPPNVGREMLMALEPVSETRLAHGIAKDFGQAAWNEYAGLRRMGWDYAQIASLSLFLKTHPQSAPRARALMAQKCDWPTMAHRLRANVDSLDAQARSWIVSTLVQ